MKKKILKFVLLLILIFATCFYFCSNPKKQTGICYLRINNDNFDRLIYAGSFKKISSKCFNDEVKIDSGLKILVGDTIVCCDVLNKKSHLRFIKFDRTDSSMELTSAEISSDIIKKTGGIYYGMKREPFFNKLNIKERSNDTINLSYTDGGYYYIFIFSNDSLMSISKKMIEM